ncbi:FAD-dependent monooxygenase [Streptomyces sp. Go40/10]|uniref:FAD-dependent monooxygenase n=1 Tax=Streptomyces sp. Go40/10 TaxID=2825844 RepID=UPI001E436A1C|nr:FAD-dependent monooxygenase [Streptomyces sp. Go40/10]UFR05228.1 FAD-dependent monooxygenase [Streptomyces sp. Go40/10]
MSAPGTDPSGDRAEDRAEPADVLVVGAGPTGLLLAGDLAAAGVRVTLLERRAHADANLTRAFAVHARSLEVLDARGLGDELVTLGRTAPVVGVFGRLELHLHRLRSRYPFVLITPQYNTERLLERRALAAGVRIVRGAEVVALRRRAGAVEADTAGAGTFRAAYLVGCDGVRSAVRRLTGIGFPGRSVLRSVMLADVRLKELPTEAVTTNANRYGFASLVPFGDGWYRAIGWIAGDDRPDDAPVEPEELAGLLRRVLGSDHGLHEPRWISRFHTDERQAVRYRDGRVLLAGDAAHVHSPAGGMGMNTGLQDAANLGWKLAAVVQGRAGEPLLDSYQRERYPVGRQTLRISGAITRGVLSAPRSSAVRRLRDLALPAVSRLSSLTALGESRLSGIGVSYPAPRGSHRLTGQRVPDLRLAGGRRLYEVLRDGRFVLVTRGRPVPGTPWLNVAAPAGELRTTLLVRPDGHIAWAADEPDPGALRGELQRWPVLG